MATLLGDFKLENVKTTNDISFFDGDFVFLTDAVTSTIQRLRQKLLLWQGEWFLNTEAGVPWLQDFLGQKPQSQVWNSIFRDLLNSDPSVESIETINFDFDFDNRQLQVNFTVKLYEVDESQTVNFELGI